MGKSATGIRKLHTNIDIIAIRADKVTEKPCGASLSSEGVRHNPPRKPSN
jgi:hypothetical protein